MSSRIRQAETPYLRKQALEFQVGDTVDVATRIVEGDKERIQTFTGRVIRRRGAGLAETFTVRRIVMGEGVERIFPLHSPRIAGVKVVSRGAVRRSKLYYLRRRVGKATRLRELIGEVEGAEAAVATPGAAAATSEPAAPAGTAAAGTAAAGKAPAEKPAPEKAPPAKAAAPKPAAAQAPAAKPPAEKGTSEKGTSEKGTAEKGTAEKSTAEKGTAEKSTAEKSAEKASPQPAAKAAPAVKPAKS